jgi:hypothetical protein
MKVVKKVWFHEDTFEILLNRIETNLDAILRHEGTKIISVNIVPLSYPGGRYGVIFYSQEEA